jgi:diguanylate cyclase (GGDEF)-like protein
MLIVRRVSPPPQHETYMPRSPLPRTLLAILPILGALLAARAAQEAWPIPLSLLAMAVIASAAAVIYWSAPIDAAKRSAGATAAETFTPAEVLEQSPPDALVLQTVPDIAAAVARTEDVAVLTAGAVPEPGTTGTRADMLATGEQYETDLLTGLLAPRSFFVNFATALSRCEAANQTAILVICDLDAFGEINRNIGLMDANRMLRQVADCFRLTVREGDILARLGGDEFAIFFPGLPPEVAETRVRDLRAAIREAGLLTLPDDTPQVTACIGTSSFPADGRTAEALMVAAEQAITEAKRDRQENANKPIPSALVLTRN